MSDPYDMPTCITCGDVAMFCSCIEKEYDKTMKKYRDGKKCPECLDQEECPGGDDLDVDEDPFEFCYWVQDNLNFGGCDANDCDSGSVYYVSDMAAQCSDCLDQYPNSDSPECDIFGQDCVEGEVELWNVCYNIEETTELDLSWGGLTGEIPEQIGSLTNLTYLNLQYNLLSGEIPSEIGSLTNLSELNLGENDLSGGIPSNIQNLINLSILRLGYNEITGEIPSWIGDMTNLTGLSLNSNQLIGGIPPEIGNLTNLTYLYLDSNLLTGHIPETICNLNNLYFSPWVLQNNYLCPPYPECIENDIGYQNTSECNECPDNIEGDFNFDGSVNVIDIILLVDLILSNQYDICNDINLDDSINVMDIIIINIILDN